MATFGEELHRKLLPEDKTVRALAGELAVTEEKVRLAAAELIKQGLLEEVPDEPETTYHYRTHSQDFVDRTKEAGLG